MIPNHFHFIFFTKPCCGCPPIPFSLHHYLCLKSCYVVNQPDSMTVYIDGEEPINNTWWELSKQFIRVEPREPTRQIGGTPIPTHSATADLLRAEILYEKGGVYADIDSLFIRSFADLLKHDLVFACNHEDTLGVNCIMSRKGHPFIGAWLQHGVKATEPEWGSFGSKQVMYLWRAHPEAVTPVKLDCLNFNTYDDHGKAALYKHNLLHTHPGYMLDLCQASAHKNYLSKLTIPHILEYNSTYNVLARRFLDTPVLGITVIIPFQADFPERVENAITVIRYLKEQLYVSDVILVETSPEPTMGGLINTLFDDNVRYMYVKRTKDDHWSRTKPFNCALPWVNTSVVAIWDTDVIVPLTRLTASYNEIAANRSDVVVPYHEFYHIKRKYIKNVQEGRFNYNEILNEPGAILEKFSTIGAGCALFATDVIRHARGFNELFIGWGFEDDEIVTRLNGMGFRCVNIQGPLVHIAHPRGTNSAPVSDFNDLSIGERERVVKMSKEELYEYFGITPEVGKYSKLRQPEPYEGEIQKYPVFTPPHPGASSTD